MLSNRLLDSRALYCVELRTKKPREDAVALTDRVSSIVFISFGTRRRQESNFSAGESDLLARILRCTSNHFYIFARNSVLVESIVLATGLQRNNDVINTFHLYNEY